MRSSRLTRALVGAIAIAIAVMATVAGPAVPSQAVVGGRTAENPWAVRINFVVDKPTAPGETSPSWCSGSLISAEWVLTAKHCLIGKPDSYTVVNNWTPAHSDPIGVVDRIVGSDDVDLALLHLNAPFRGLPVPFPKLSPFVGMGEAVVEGYGMINTSQASTSLKHAVVRVTSVSRIPLLQWAANSTIWSSGVTGQALWGDSGGPLTQAGQIIGVVYRGGVLEGLGTLFGRDWFTPTSSAAYTNVGPSIPWILQVTGLKPSDVLSNTVTQSIPGVTVAVGPKTLATRMSPLGWQTGWRPQLTAAAYVEDTSSTSPETFTLLVDAGSAVQIQRTSGTQPPECLSIARDGFSAAWAGSSSSFVTCDPSDVTQKFAVSDYTTAGFSLRALFDDGQCLGVRELGQGSTLSWTSCDKAASFSMFGFGPSVAQEQQRIGALSQARALTHAVAARNPNPSTSVSTTDPSDAVVDAGSSASFTASASGAAQAEWFTMCAQCSGADSEWVSLGRHAITDGRDTLSLQASTQNDGTMVKARLWSGDKYYETGLAKLTVTGASAYPDARTGLFQTSDWSVWRLTGVPSGSTPVAQDLWLKDGQLWRQVDGARASMVASGVAAVGQLVERRGRDGVFTMPVTFTDGRAGLYRTGENAVRTAQGIPSRAIPVAQDLWLKDGQLWRQVDGQPAALIASNVYAVGQMLERREKDGMFAMPVTFADGSAGLYQTEDFSVWRAWGIPSGATPLAQDLWLKDGELWRVSDMQHASVVLRGVSSAGQMVERREKDGVFDLPVTLMNGWPYLYQSSARALPNPPRSGTIKTPPLPSGATPVAHDLWLKDGQLWRLVTPLKAALVATGVVSVGQMVERVQKDGVFYLPQTVQLR